MLEQRKEGAKKHLIDSELIQLVKKSYEVMSLERNVFAFAALQKTTIAKEVVKGFDFVS